MLKVHVGKRWGRTEEVTRSGGMNGQEGELCTNKTVVDEEDGSCRSEAEWKADVVEARLKIASRGNR